MRRELIVHLLPAAEVGQQLYVEALVAVFLGAVDVVRDASGFSLEGIGEDGICGGPSPSDMPSGVS